LGLSPGAETLVAAAKAAGIYTLLVSGGFNFFTNRLKERLGLDAAFSNQLEIVDGKLTGRVVGPLCDADAKAQHVRDFAQQLGASREQIMVIGDGANDLKMMAVAGTSVAYYAKPIVQAQATMAINAGGLDEVLRRFPAP
jgi:phosphoserine phosphatase